MAYDFAHQLLGRELPDGWLVIEKIEKTPDQTGGHFSVGYRVQRSDGTRAFCKALDFTAAFAAPDPARELEHMTQAFNFERDLLGKCRDRRMDRVVSVIGDGRVFVEDGNPQSAVPYLLFELAEGDIRQFAKFAAELDLAWAVRSLHHVATGLMQLHRAGVAHQDLKPSNVMMFGNAGSKIGDVGRATDRTRPMPHDDLHIAGAWPYAPPELLYGEVANDWAVRRAACDLYLLGSLAHFFFTGVSTTASILRHLASEVRPASIGGPWTASYRDALPQVRHAFGATMAEFDLTVPFALRREMSSVIRQLCDPEPARRGDPTNHIGHRDPYSLEQYVSRFDRMARKAESRMFT